MGRRRFFVEKFHNQHAEINGDDARHLVQVLRVEPGQKFELCDNAEVYLAEVESRRKDRVVFRTLERLEGTEPLVRIDLYASLIKFDHLEWILEKATELGVASIHLVEATRSEKGLERAAEKRMTRWRRVVLEASQQSRRARLPELDGPVPLAQALKAEATHRLFLDEEPTGIPVLTAIPDRNRTDTVALILGPEGGWTDAERTAATAAHWKLVTLGPQILRAETAAVAALGVVNALYLT
jgi:16S rRNA (uracil1498-N3)-methyltransferase